MKSIIKSIFTATAKFVLLIAFAVSLFAINSEADNIINASQILKNPYNTNLYNKKEITIRFKIDATFLDDDCIQIIVIDGDTVEETMTRIVIFISLEEAGNLNLSKGNIIVVRAKHIKTVSNWGETSLRSITSLVFYSNSWIEKLRTR